MDRLASLLASTSKVRRSNDDDFTDRLSSRYSVVILVLFAILVSMNQYVRNPITCWAPVHFTGAHTKFTTNYCWVKNTYYLPWDSELPRPWEDDKRHMIPYYQWIPFILLAQAALFYIPTIVWHGLNQKAGVDADNILVSAHTIARIDKVEHQDRTLRMLCNQLDRFLSNRPEGRGCQCNIKSILSSTCCRLCGTRFGNYLVFLFLFSKICYIGNAIGQLFLLNTVLSTKYNTFGPDMVRNIITGNDQSWAEDSYVAFPRVTYCDFQIRGQDLGNVQRYTVQCVLPINLYNEKIYMFLWFWMAFVAAASVLSFIVWVIRSLSRTDRINFIRNHLELGGRLDRSSTTAVQIKTFTSDYLKQDGALLFRLIAHNCNNIVTTEIICAVWDFWKDKEGCDEEKPGRFPSSKREEGNHEEDELFSKK